MSYQNIARAKAIEQEKKRLLKRLKKASYERFGNEGMGGELVINLDDAIEIIKGGGKDE